MGIIRHRAGSARRPPAPPPRSRNQRQPGLARHAPSISDRLHRARPSPGASRASRVSPRAPPPRSAMPGLSSIMRSVDRIRVAPGRREWVDQCRRNAARRCDLYCRECRHLDRRLCRRRAHDPQVEGPPSDRPSDAPGNAAHAATPELRRNVGDLLRASAWRRHDPCWLDGQLVFHRRFSRRRDLGRKARKLQGRASGPWPSRIAYASEHE